MLSIIRKETKQSHRVDIKRSESQSRYQIFSEIFLACDVRGTGRKARNTIILVIKCIFAGTYSNLQAKLM